MKAITEPVKRLDEILKAVRAHELGPLDAFLQIKQFIQPDESFVRLRKRFQFWAFELSSYPLENLSPKEKLLYLRKYFFEEKAKVLKNIIAPQVLIGLAMQNVSNLTGLTFNFVLLGSHLALKTEVEGECQYISLDDGGRVLDTQEVLDLIFNFGKIKRIDFNDLLLAYLEFFQKQLDPKVATQQIFKIYDLILSLKAADPRTLLRRAYLHKEIGQISEAMFDFKRYLNFQSPENVARTLKKFYSQL